MNHSRNQIYFMYACFRQNICRGWPNFAHLSRLGVLVPVQHIILYRTCVYQANLTLSYTMLHSYSRTPYQLWLYQSIYFNYHVLDRTLNWDHDPRIHNSHRNRISNTGSLNVRTNPDPKHSLVSWCASSSYYPRPSSLPLLALYQN